MNRFIQGRSKARVKYSMGRFRKVREQPKARSIFSSKVGSLGSWWILLQNQMISATTMGKKMDLRDSQTLVKPPFWPRWHKTFYGRNLRIFLLS